MNHDGGGTVDAGAAVLWSAETGPPSGPLVVLVHGTMDRSSGMLALARRLDERSGGSLRVARYDRRGYGRSALGGPCTVSAHVADLVGLLGGRRAVLVGHSFGGNVALAVAARHPALVAAVAVYEAPMSWESWWPRGSAGAAAVAEVDPARAAEVFMRRVVGDARWEALPERTKAVRRAEGAAMVAELADLRRQAPWRVEDLRVPVVSAYGERARPHHAEAMRRLGTAVRGGSAVCLAGCGHDAPTSAPAAVADEVVVPTLRAAGQPWAAAV